MWEDLATLLTRPWYILLDVWDVDPIESPAKSMMDVKGVGLTTGGNIPAGLFQDFHCPQGVSLGRGLETAETLHILLLGMLRCNTGSRGDDL